MTDRQVEKEIEQLVNDPFVKLAKAEQRLRYKRRQYLYQLRSLAKKGVDLAAAGYTLENIAEMMNDTEEET